MGAGRQAHEGQQCGKYRHSEHRPEDDHRGDEGRDSRLARRAVRGNRCDHLYQQPLELCHRSPWVCR
jgi:hypothetical protein